VLLARAVWAPAGILVVHLVATGAFDAYTAWPALDVPMHLAGGAAIAHFWKTIVPPLLEPALATPRLAHVERVLVFALVGLAAVVWEFTELLSDRLLGTSLLRSLEDTLADLLFGLVGGVAYLLVREITRRRLPKA
jgi:hypothetical protein